MTSKRNFESPGYIIKKGKCFKSMLDYKNEIKEDDLFHIITQDGYFHQAFMILTKSNCVLKNVNKQTYKYIYNSDIDSFMASVIKSKNRDNDKPLISDLFYMSYTDDHLEPIYSHLYKSDNIQEIKSEFYNKMKHYLKIRKRDSDDGPVRKKRRLLSSEKKKNKSLSISTIAKLLNDLNIDLNDINLTNFITPLECLDFSKDSWSIYLDLIKCYDSDLYNLHNHKLNDSIESDGTFFEFDKNKNIKISYYDAFYITHTYMIKTYSTDEYRDFFKDTKSLSYTFYEMKLNRYNISIAYYIYKSMNIKKNDDDLLFDYWQ